MPPIGMKEIGVSMTEDKKLRMAVLPTPGGPSKPMTLPYYWLWLN